MNRLASHILAWSVFAALPLGAQATTLVPPGERVYRDIGRLAAAGLIDSLVVGARPFSEREVARLLHEARANLDRNPQAHDWASRTIESDLARYAPAEQHGYDAITVELIGMSSPYRGIPRDANGEIDAAINPLVGYRGARPVADGATASVETRHSARLGSHVALAFNPRVTAFAPRGAASDATVGLQAASANFLFGNFAVEVGRDYAIFGQSLMGGLLVSDNAPTMDLVRLSNDRPAVLPWFLRLLGPTRAGLFIADLGSNRQLHPHTKLAGYHIAFLPHPRFELGAEVLDAMGGRGGQPASFGDRIVDAIPLVDAIFRSGTDFQFSNKMAGIDFHWRMPAWAGFELYGEGAADDFDIRRLRSVLLEDSGYILGAALTCIVKCGRFGVRGEYHQTGIRYYTHTDYPLERRGLLLGDPLGPRGVAGYLTLDGDTRSVGYLGLTTAFEVRSGNQYGSQANGPSTEGFHFVQTAHYPAEKRARAVGSWTPDLSRRIGMQLSIGAERVTNFRFVAGNDRTNWMARTAITLRP